MSVPQTTLVFVVQDEQILLGKKKEGHGKGKWNGPGGKMENQDDSITETAIRETREEIGIEVSNLEKLGEIDFHFNETLSHTCHIFHTNSFTGTTEESQEMIPQWFDWDNLPLEEMWEGDKHWIQNIIDKNKFEGSFYFDKDNDLKEWKVKGRRSWCSD